MILIQKTSAPESLRRYCSNRSNLQKSWEDFGRENSKIKDDIRQSLLKEQGYICAYCMRSLETDCKIEHYRPKSKYPKDTYNYINLFVVDKESKKYNNCCEVAKGNKEITFNPTEQSCIDTLYYYDNGEIHSCNPLYEKEINNILNLNSLSLKNLRENTFKQCMLYFDNTTTENELNEKMENLLKKENGEPYLSMIGIYIWYSNKILRKKFKI